MDWIAEYEVAYEETNNRPCTVMHTGSGWYAIFDGKRRNKVEGLAHFGSRYRRKQIEQMTENLRERTSY